MHFAGGIGKENIHQEKGIRGCTCIMREKRNE